MDPFEADQLRETFRHMVAEDMENATADLGPGHFGPGVWIRIKHRFRTRNLEWALAVITALWGASLLPGAAYDQPDFAGFRTVFGNAELGWAMVILGSGRLIGLIVNGALKNVTPHIRMVSAGIGGLIFFCISYFYMLSGIVSPWLAIYPSFVVCELANLYNAAHDVGEARNGRDT